MLTITQDQKDKFINISNKTFDTDIKFLNIIVLNDIPDIISTLLVNNTSFNYLIDKDGIIEVVPEGKLSNGGYKLKETIYCNKNIPHLTFGIVPKNELSMLPELIFLKQKLMEFAVSKQMRLALGTNVHILTPSDNKSIFYKFLSEKFIIDTTFNFFSSLFIL